MSTESKELKSMGKPFPLLVKPSRIPLTNTSAVWPRMLGLDGAPKLVVVKLLVVSLVKSRTSRTPSRHLVREMNRCV